MVVRMHQENLFRHTVYPYFTNQIGRLKTQYLGSKSLSPRIAFSAFLHIRSCGKAFGRLIDPLLHQIIKISFANGKLMLQMLIANSTPRVMVDIHSTTPQRGRNDFAALQVLIKDCISSSSLVYTVHLECPYGGFFEWNCY